MRIVQITDSHVQAPGVLWKNRVNMAARLAAGVAAANALAPDLVVHAGDVVDGGDDVAYAVAADLLSALDAPLRLLPGNHDARDGMRRAFPAQAWPDGAFLGFAETHEGLTLLGLDTVEEHRTAGRFCADRAADLAARLAEAPGPTLVFQHHPPCAMGLPHMDRFVFEGSDLYAEALAERPPLRIACGHVHAAAERHWAGTLVSACPALGVQIPPAARPDAPFGFIDGGAHLRVFDWDAATGLTVKTVPVGPQDGPHPFETDPNADFDATPRV
ncbi:MAG: metallophosphoesterase [Pseudomonadota bacterium]